MDEIENIMGMNRKLLSSLEEAQNGPLIKYSALHSDFIKKEIRERGFLRSILPAKKVTNEDLDRTEEGSSLPLIIRDMEPSSRGAVTLPFKTTADSTFYSEDRYSVVFDYISTREHHKDINELRTQKMDIRAVTVDNNMRDIETHEDARLINLFDEIVGPSNDVSPYSGVQQHFAINGDLTRDTAPTLVNYLLNSKLPNGVFLCNHVTFNKYLRFTRDMAGGELSQNMFKEGASALKKRCWGVDHIVTIKREIVPDNVFYLLTEPGYLGEFLELMPLTMYMRREEDQIFHKAKELVGLTIANVRGVVKVTFQPN